MNVVRAFYLSGVKGVDEDDDWFQPGVSACCFSSLHRICLYCDRLRETEMLTYVRFTGTLSFVTYGTCEGCVTVEILMNKTQSLRSNYDRY